MVNTSLVLNRNDRQKDFRGTILLFLLIIGLLVVFAYRFEPRPAMDLARYYASIEAGDVDRFNADIYGDRQSADFFVVYLMNFLVRCGVSSHCLGAICALIYFGLLAKISLIWSQKGCVFQRPVLLFIAFVFSGYFLGFTGVRQGIANLVLVLALSYFAFGENKKAIFSAVFAGLIHFSLIPIIALLVISVACSRKCVYTISIVLCVSSFFFPAIIGGVQSSLVSLGGIGGPIASKIDAYVFSGGATFDEVLYFLSTGRESYTQECFWAGSRWWVVQGFVAVIAMVFVALFQKRFFKISFSMIDVDKFVLLLFAYLIFTIHAPAIPMRAIAIMKYVFVLCAIPIATKTNNMIVQFFVVVFWGLALLASFSGQEILIFIKGGY